MTDIAILITVFNRKAETIRCLDSVERTWWGSHSALNLTVFLTDDGSTDGTADAIASRNYAMETVILNGSGQLYWNGGMINSWKAALVSGKRYNGYLWLNNDTTILDGFWEQLQGADAYCHKQFSRGGIYVGSTCSSDGQTFTYGGFNFANKLTLKDVFVKPNGSFQTCQCAHGNLTYVSQDVVDRMDIFTDEYIHSGGDHDYTYRAYRQGWPLLVLPSFCGICNNDHPEDGYADFLSMPLRERIRYLKSPLGFNLHNTLVFQRRCFPYRYPFVWLMGYAKAFFPKLYWKVYKRARS